MTDPIPVRLTEAVRVTRAAEVVETVRVTEYASSPPVARQGPPALPCGEHPYRPECCSPIAGSRMDLDWTDKPRKALPPGSPTPPRPWWRRWLP